eukprot:9144983-Pyramimonas_sp.AAC.1
MCIRDRLRHGQRSTYAAPAQHRRSSYASTYAALRQHLPYSVESVPTYNMLDSNRLSTLRVPWRPR